MNWIYSTDLGNALFGMLADIAGDIILKTDKNGFIERASPDFHHLGIEADELLIWPHIADLADKRFAAGVREYVSLVLRGTPQLDAFEFPLARTGKSNEGAQQEPAGRPATRWFALRLRPTPGGDGATVGALGMLRSIERPNASEGRTFASGLVDHLTGLGNRTAFTADVGKRLALGCHKTMALIEIDSFRSVSLRYGPSSGQEMICAFADFLLVMLGQDSSLARLGGSRFAFITEHKDSNEAHRNIVELLRTFAQLSAEMHLDGPAITASAGLSHLGGSADLAIARAEKALILAGTAGGSRVEIAENLPHYLTRERCRA